MVSKCNVLVVLMAGLGCVGCEDSEDSGPREVPTLDYRGPGVKDPEYVRGLIKERLARVNAAGRSYDRETETWWWAKGMAEAMTWDQACYVYRTEPPGSWLKVHVLNGMVFGVSSREGLIGITREQLIAIYGEPDAVYEEEADGSTYMYYSGAGTFSDSTPAYFFHMTPEGRVESAHVGQ